MRRFLIAACVVLAASPVFGDGAFYRVLAAKPNATFEDAVKAFYELSTETPPGDAGFDALAKTLADRKVIRSEWIQAPQEKLTRGRAAYMVCRACAIRGGLTMTVFGTSERYAFRECIYMGLWTGGNQRDLVTGGELMGVLKWAADYVEEHQKKGPNKAAPADKSAEKPVDNAGEKTSKSAPSDGENRAESSVPVRQTGVDRGSKPGTILVENAAESAQTEGRKAVGTAAKSGREGVGISAEKSTNGGGESARSGMNTGRKPEETPHLTAGQGTICVVQSGDTLAGLSERYYGDARYWSSIAKANSLNGGLIRIGQTLVIPPSPDGPQVAAEEKKSQAH